MKHNPAVLTPVKKFLDSIVVYDTTFTKVRMGNEHDGGYVVLQEVCDKTPMVYSFGVAEDVGFEMAWVNKYPKAKIKLHDPYIDKLPEQHNRFTFNKYGIGNSYKPITNVVKDSMLKMDVEWSEWGAFTMFDPDELAKFSQIVFEAHILHVEPPSGLSPYFFSMHEDFCEKINNDIFTQYELVMKHLFNWFVIFHIHANNSLPARFVDGYWFPPLIEVSMVRKNLVGKDIKKSNVDFPVAGLDLPNKTNRPDIIDYYPLGGRNGFKRTK